MKKNSLPYFSRSRFVLALTFAQIASLSFMNAMEEPLHPTKDDHHDRALRHTLDKHQFCPKHFFVPSEETVLIYDVKNDINAASLNRSATIHQENLTSLGIGGPASCFPSSASSDIEDNLLPPSAWHSTFTYPLYLAGTMIESLASWPNWLSFSPTTTPALIPVFPNSSPSVTYTEDGHEFVVLELKQENISPSSLRNTPENDAEDFSMKGASSLPRDYVIYSGEGGGVRGLLIALLLARLERKTNTPICHIFDYVGGTSISGILGLGLTMSKDGKNPCMSGADLVDLLKNHSAEIFPTASHWNVPARIWNSASSLFYSQYDPQPLENLLQQHLGQLKLNSALTNVMVTAVDPSLNAPRNLDNNTDPECLAWHAARASSAAPTYFKAYKVESIARQPYLVDGGLYQNNPAFVTLMQLKDFVQTRQQQPFQFNQVTLLSLGTGDVPINPIPNNAGIFPAVAPLIEACMQTQVRGTHMTLTSLLKENETYFRLNPSLDRPIPLDNLSDENTELLTQAAESQFEMIDKFAELDVVRKRLEGLTRNSLP